MVHGLEVLRRINGQQAKKPPEKAKPWNVPAEIAGNPAATRRFLNRPLTAAERGNQPDYYASYAESNRAPFNGKRPKSEGRRD